MSSEASETETSSAGSGSSGSSKEATGEKIADEDLPLHLQKNVQIATEMLSTADYKKEITSMPPKAKAAKKNRRNRS